MPIHSLTQLPLSVKINQYSNKDIKSPITKRVAYLLGAGFSRPWGLPLMDDFISKSKELFLSNQIKYKHFDKIYNLLNNYSKIKNYLNVDLYNIENLLSIIEMDDQFNNLPEYQLVENFIKEVIKGYTKDYRFSKRLDNIFATWVFGDDKVQINYFNFITNLLNLQFERLSEQDSNKIIVKRKSEIEYLYSVVSLNYDLLLENALYTLKNEYNCIDIPVFSKEQYDPTWFNVNLAKIHGCIEKDIIIPPTWNKIKYVNIIQDWKMAKNILSDANILRIVGYSLPDTDTYIKYLLAVAINNSFYLERIEVYCLDDNNHTIEKRYMNFLSNKNFNFYNTTFFESFPVINVFLNILGNISDRLIVMDGLK